MNDHTMTGSLWSARRKPPTKPILNASYAATSKPCTDGKGPLQMHCSTAARWLSSTSHSCSLKPRGLVPAKSCNRVSLSQTSAVLADEVHCVGVRVLGGQEGREAELGIQVAGLSRGNSHGRVSHTERDLFTMRH